MYYGKCIEKSAIVTEQSTTMNYFVAGDKGVVLI